MFASGHTRRRRRYVYKTLQPGVADNSNDKLL